MALGFVAAPPALADESSPPIVRVFVAGSSEAVARSRDAVQELCEHSNVAVIVRDAAGADEELLSTSHPPGLAEAYIDLREGMPARVVVVDSQTRENLERRTLPEASSLEMSIETAAHVVCAAVESAILARSAREATARKAPPPAPVAPRDTKPKRGAGVESRVSAFGVMSDFGFGLLGGGGAAFGLRFGDSNVSFGLTLPLYGYARGEVQRLGGETSYVVVSTRLLPTVDWQVTRHLGLFSSLGAGADWVHVEPALPPQGDVLRGGGKTVEAIGSALVGATVNITPRAGALLTFGLDIDLTPHRYVIESSTGLSTFFDPSRVRPIGMAGAFFSFGGADRWGMSEPSEKRQ